MPKPTPVNLAHKLSLFSEQWSPKIIAETADHHFKVAKLDGDFQWHSHADTDEVFWVIAGDLRIDFRDGSVEMGAGDMVVVPAGVEHKPFAANECHVMIMVGHGTVNTGDGPSNERTADPNARI